MVDEDRLFMITCHIELQIGMVGRFLSEEFGYYVIDLKGGIRKLLYDGYQLSPIESIQ